MSFEVDRIGRQSGEWFERYVETIFGVAGFQTSRRRRITDAVTHEIDIWAESEFATVAVECKDWRYPWEQPIKQSLDAFITKRRLINADAGLFTINLPTSEVHPRYSQYLRQNGMLLWTMEDVEKWHRDIQRYEKLEYQKRLCDVLGIMIHEPTKQETTFKILKTLGKAALKTAKVSAEVSLKVADELSREDPPRRRPRYRKKGYRNRTDSRKYY
jgi:hypothetical protein